MASHPVFLFDPVNLRVNLRQAQSYLRIGMLIWSGDEKRRFKIMNDYIIETNDLTKNTGTRYVFPTSAFM